jgi:ribosomal protein S18 acetylase RimI-like enzyme
MSQTRSERPMASLLDRLEWYYDAVPRSRADVEQVGPFTLFVARSGWPYYARPRLGARATITTDDIDRVFGRQDQLGVPRAVEWVDDTTPGLAEAFESAGTPVHRCPLLVLDGEPRGEAGAARLLTPDEVDDLRLSRAAVGVAFGNSGTASGPAGLAERDSAADADAAPLDGALIERMRAGLVVQAAVYDPDALENGPVGGGSYLPVDSVAEIAGVGVLPAFRRRGLAAQVTYVLASDARAHGVETVFCSADSDDVARVYGRIGFVRVGTACIVEP